MPQKRKSMNQVRKILVLHLQTPPMSVRTIARATGVSRPVVQSYIDRLEGRALPLDELESMSDSQLMEHLGLVAPAVQPTPDNSVLLAWLGENIARLQERGMTRRLLHEDYLQAHPQGLQYSQFCFVLKQQYQAPEASSLLEHKAGDKLYIDYTGQKLVWTDVEGTRHTEEVFLAVLGASGLLYAVPSFSQRQEDLAASLISCFECLGGVPRAVVPDCLKSAVVEHDGWEPRINSLFQEVVEHYQTVCLPARPKHPKDKALVEGAVNLIYRQILARLKPMVFDGRPQMLQWWRVQVDRINATAFQKLPGSRQSRFEAIDRPALKALPATEFTLQAIGRQTVTATGVVYVPQDKTSYSVPYSLQGMKVEVLSFPDRIEVWHENQRVAIHQRQPDAGQVIQGEHRPPAHRWYEERDHQELIRGLCLRGANVSRWSQEVALRCEHEDQAWQLLTGFTKLADKYLERIDTVCRLAVKRQQWRLRDLKEILKSEEDLRLAEAEQISQELPFHENVRGPEYYQGQAVGI
jgi:transposase